MKVWYTNNFLLIHHSVHRMDYGITSMVSSCILLFTCCFYSVIRGNHPQKVSTNGCRIQGRGGLKIWSAWSHLSFFTLGSYPWATNFVFVILYLLIFINDSSDNYCFPTKYREQTFKMQDNFILSIHKLLFPKIAHTVLAISQCCECRHFAPQCNVNIDMASGGRSTYIMRSNKPFCSVDGELLAGANRITLTKCHSPVSSVEWSRYTFDILGGRKSDDKKHNQTIHHFGDFASRLPYCIQLTVLVRIKTFSCIQLIPYRYCLCRSSEWFLLTFILAHLGDELLP